MNPEDEFMGMCNKIKFSCNIKDVTSKEIFDKYNAFISHLTNRNDDYINQVWKIIPRGFVYYPDFLKEYIKNRDIDEIDLACMICRCIEHSNSSENKDILIESLNMLIEYISKNNLKVNLLLLRGKYNMRSKIAV